MGSTTFNVLDFAACWVWCVAKAMEWNCGTVNSLRQYGDMTIYAGDWTDFLSCGEEGTRTCHHHGIQGPVLI